MNRDAQTFSSEQNRGGVVVLEQGNTSLTDEGRMMLTMDPPEHTRYRKLVNRGFTPRMINALGPKIREAVIEILDKAVEKGGCDFVLEVAAELPLQVIAQLLGVPFEDRHKVFDWSNRLIGSRDPEYAVSEELARGAAIEMFMYAQELAEKRRKDPHDDIVTTLLAETDGDRLSEIDFNIFFLLLAVAGNETTRNALSHGLYTLIQHPEQYRMLVDDPALVPAATEEILRWASPVMYFRRNVTRDTELGGAAAQGRRQAQHLVHLRQSRRGDLRRSLQLRHQAQPQRARRVRRRRAALLPGRKSRQTRDEHHVRRIGQAGGLGRDHR